MVDPRRRNYDRLGSRYNLLAGGVNLFLLMMTGLIIAESLRPGSLRVENLVFAAIGLLFAMMGNFMPKAGSNFAFGIRNMWTLSSETVWKRTHRMAGKLWFVGGLVLFLLGLSPLEKMALYAPAVAIFLVLGLVPTAYSFLLWRQENPTPDTDSPGFCPHPTPATPPGSAGVFYWQIHRKAGDFFGLSTALWDGKMKTDRAARRLGNLL